MTRSIKWLAQPEDQDYPAALSYLSLHYDERRAAALVELLRTAPLATFKAKDIFRASRLPLLGISNHHVQHNRSKIADGKALSPLLLVRGERLIVADGYHRLCAVYGQNEDIDIHCKIV